MNHRVRDLYKRFMVAGRVYPGGIEVVRRRTKEAFFSNAHITDKVEVLRAIRIGRHMVRELYAVAQLKKYRNMKSKYN